MRIRSETAIENTDDVQDRYRVDSFIARYASVWAYGAVGGRMSEPYYTRLLALCADSIRCTGARRVLDVGCGPGRVVADLAREHPGVEFTGIDRSAAMIRLAQQIVQGPRGEPVAVDASDHGFPPARIPAYGLLNVRLLEQSLEDELGAGEPFDVVIASHLLDRVPSPVLALKALTELVAPGGALVLSCAFNYLDREQWEELREAAGIAAQLRAAGLGIDDFDADVPYPEQLDDHGTVTQHRVLLLRARKEGAH